jgi:hypothetical protein
MEGPIEDLNPLGITSPLKAKINPRGNLHPLGNISPRAKKTGVRKWNAYFLKKKTGFSLRQLFSNINILF